MLEGIIVIVLFACENVTECEHLGLKIKANFDEQNYLPVTLLAVALLLLTICAARGNVAKLAKRLLNPNGIILMVHIFLMLYQRQIEMSQKKNTCGNSVLYRIFLADLRRKIDEMLKAIEVLNRWPF